MLLLQKKILFFSCFILVIGLMAIDFLNPSLPYIMNELNVSQSSIKGLMIVYMMTVGLAQFFYGSYSDVHGRKKAILISFVIAITGFVISALSQNILMLYIGRFLTALGTAGCPVIARALIADVFHEEIQIRKAFSYFTMSSQFSPGFAPVLGGIVQHYFNWHWSFVVLALLNLVVAITVLKFMPESHCQPDLKKTFQNQIKLYIALFKKKRFMIFNLESALIFVFTIGYYSLSPFVFHRLGYTAIQNGFFFSVYAVGLVLGALCLATILKTLDAKKIFLATIIFYPLLFAAFAIIFSFTNAPSLIVVFSFLLAFNCGICAAQAISLCMQGFTEDRGSASAVQSFVKMFFTGAALLVFNFIELNTFVDLMFIFFTISVVMISLLYFVRPE